jgi:hypothetical protein
MLGSSARCLFGPGSTWTSSPKIVLTGRTRSKQDQQREYHVLPGPNKRRECKPSILLSWIRRGGIISPAASFVLPIPLSNAYFCASRCPFGQIDHWKHMLGRFRSHFQKMCWRVDLSQVKLILSPKQRAKPKTSAQKTGRRHEGRSIAVIRPHWPLIYILHSKILVLMW